VHGGRHGLAALYWQRAESLKGRDMLFFTQGDNDLPALMQSFGAVEEEAPFVVRSGDRVASRVRFYRCRNWQGPEGVFSRLGP